LDVGRQTRTEGVGLHLHETGTDGCDPCGVTPRAS
jgi:hypothetical protein